MASASSLQVHFNTPTFKQEDIDIEATRGSNASIDGERNKSSRPYSLLRNRNSRTLRLAEDSNSIIRGSFAQPSKSPRGSLDSKVLGVSPIPSPRASTSHLQLEHLLQIADADLDGYGLEESRDGFFDASFHRPLKQNHEDLMSEAAETLPDAFKGINHPLSARRFIPQQAHGARAFFVEVTSSMAGVRLLKTFLGFFITYVICLIPASRDWLGKYSHIMVVSAIFNHPGRAVGSQLDGAILTILGTLAGLGWGSVALYVSTSTSTAQSGYGGILATFLLVFAALIGWLRCIFIRLYQVVICAGLAIVYTCLADTSQSVGWKKVFDYGIPWVLGQAVCLIVAILVLPDTGTRSLVLSLHSSLDTIQAGLVLPSLEDGSIKRKLASQFVEISEAVRDFILEFTVSRFLPKDVVLVRNLIQSVIRSVLAINPDTTLFDDLDPLTDTNSERNTGDGQQDPVRRRRQSRQTICHTLKVPTKNLIDAMLSSVKYADQTILAIGGQRPTEDEPNLLSQALQNLRTAKERFDSADAILVARPHLSSEYAKSPGVVQLFLFVHPVRQTADRVEALVAKILEMQQAKRKWRIRAPSYPLHKAFMRTNAQVRHDRGGLTAGHYFRSKDQLNRAMAEFKSSTYVPAARHAAGGRQALNDEAPQGSPVLGEYQREQEYSHGKRPSAKDSPKAPFRYRAWEILHRLQGFESRFALKVTLVTTLLSIPAWLPQSRGWWNDNQSWWTVVAVWIMMHPRVGGTFQDLGVRTLCAAIGAIWGGLAYAADNGNPYVMAVFAIIYMVPMLYRFTQSSHPRSGIMGCLSFTVVSLTAYQDRSSLPSSSSVVTIAWTRGLAFIVGLVAALTVNWILWPFVARHELRKSLAAMILHSAIRYRGVVAKYIYYSPGEEPTPDDIVKSEMLEGRLREGFVRMRQLMLLTRHEMRLRAPFDPRPYSALITACESFTEHLVQVRQSSLYFRPSMLVSDDDDDDDDDDDTNDKAIIESSLTMPRRDAVAVILLNLYILACALRAAKPVPRYLPSAAAARRKLLDCMDFIERERAEGRMRSGKGKEEEMLEQQQVRGKGQEEKTNTSVLQDGDGDCGKEEGKGKSRGTDGLLAAAAAAASEKDGRGKGGKKRRWADVYRYAFSAALAGIVENLREMERYTRVVCGEVEWDVEI